jgi:hypothetical protein
MKKLLIIMFSLALTLGAAAQRHGWGHGYVGGGYHSRPRVVVGIGGFYPTPFYGYNPWYDYPPVYTQAAVPSKLELQIEDISADYKDRIWSVRHDKSLSRAERRQQVHNLKSERERAILDAKRDYYKSTER